jgi:rhomboid family GlyGly-CTERM serine protease
MAVPLHMNAINASLTASLRSSLKEIFDPKRIPWIFLMVTLAATVVQLSPESQSHLIYDRAAVAKGEIWRIWTGHLVHFGWPHFIVDAGLFLILGRLLERDYPLASYASLLGMPLAIAIAMYWGDRSMIRYGGLSAINFGLLVFLALQGWQRNWIDWFWPVVFSIYVLEIVLEAHSSRGTGGGMIRFSDSSIRVATMAHVGGAAFGALLWAIEYLGGIYRRHFRRHGATGIDGSA